MLTPNLPETEALLGMRIRNARDAERAGVALREMGAKAVLLKGGHGRGREAIDRWFDARGMLELRHPRLPGDYHGTGCTLSSALAAELARGATPRTALRRAIAFVQRAMRHGFRTSPGGLVVLGVRP